MTTPFVRRGTKRFTAILAACLALGTLQACADCTTSDISGMYITPIDDGTDLPLTSTPHLRVTEGTYVETYPAPNVSGQVPKFAAAPERTGVYDILVQADGYEDVAVSGLRVKRFGRCDDIQTLFVTARMRKLAAGS